jgi:Zn-dependent peptidase ImmA (M78 family)
MDQSLISYKSVFSPNTNIMVVFKDNSSYEDLEPLFDEFGFGFYYPDDKLIVIDGEIFLNTNLTMNDLRFIEAHEISHLIMGHNGPRNESDEIEADLGAYILLERNKFPTDRLIEVFEERHGIPFSPKLLDKVKNYF